MEPLISVIVPVYKVEKYLDRCVQSLLAQTYQNTEIILVDDGSPDSCPMLCDEYAKKHENISVIHQENKGLSGARNSGIEVAKGDYLAFVDSDDLWSPHFLKSLYQALKEHDADLAQCRWEYMHGDELKEAYDPAAKTECFTGKEMLANLFIQTGAYYVVAWNKLYKKELFTNIRYPEGRIHEDEATTYKLFDAAEKCVFVDNALYGYYVGGTSITRGGFNMKKLDWRTANKERVQYFIDKGYKELVVPAIKACNDGSIDLYYRCQESCPEAKGELLEIRYGVRQSIDLLNKYKKYGKLPMQTMIGYRLFAAFPEVYQKLLVYVADMSNVEKYS